LRVEQRSPDAPLFRDFCFIVWNVSLAQSHNPEGFRYAATLSGWFEHGGFGHESNAQVACKREAGRVVSAEKDACHKREEWSAF